MATTSIYLPKSMLEALDREAARRGVSRNRLISDAVWQVLKKNDDDWSMSLFPQLRESALEEK